LWAMNLELPISAKAQASRWSTGGCPIDTVCELIYANGVQAHFDSSFVTAFRQSAEIAGTRGTLSLSDFVISKGPERAEFKTVVDPDLDEHHERVKGTEVAHEVLNCNQEVELIKTFSSHVLAKTTDPSWPELSLKTQIVLDALMSSIQRDGVVVKVVDFM